MHSKIELQPTSGAPRHQQAAIIRTEHENDEMTPSAARFEFPKKENELPTIVRSVPVDHFLDEIRNAIKAELTLQDLSRGRTPPTLQAINVKGLSGFRQAAGMSQSELAKALSVAQSSVSSLGNGDDLLFSTFTRYVRALGGECDIVVTLKDNTRLALKLEQLAS
jgi:DNA-binding transcriptional regulator YiaG